MKNHIKKVFIIIFVLSIFLAYRLTPLYSYLDIDRIFENREIILETVRSRYLLSVIIFILIYITAVGLSIPGASLLTLMGGFFFGPVPGTLYVNVGASIGALLIFLLSRYVIGKNLQVKYKVQLAKFNNELEINGTNYLLTLRLIPIFPFFLINILAGLTKVPANKFLWTTSLGIIPGSFIYAYIGFAGTTIDNTSGLISRELIIALVLLGLLALLPVLIRKMRRK